MPLIHMGDMSDVGRRTGTLFFALSISALAGPPISGAIASGTGDYKAVGYYAGASVHQGCVRALTASSGSVMLLAVAIMWYVRYLMTGKLFGGKF